MLEGQASFFFCSREDLLFCTKALATRQHRDLHVGECSCRPCCSCSLKLLVVEGGSVDYEHATYNKLTKQAICSRYKVRAVKMVTCSAILVFPPPPLSSPWGIV